MKNNAQTAIGTVIGAATAALGAWQINAGTHDALSHCQDSLDESHRTIQEIALSVSNMMERPR